MAKEQLHVETFDSNLIKPSRLTAGKKATRRKTTSKAAGLRGMMNRAERTAVRAHKAPQPHVKKSLGGQAIALMDRVVAASVQAVCVSYAELQQRCVLQDAIHKSFLHT